MTQSTDKNPIFEINIKYSDGRMLFISKLDLEKMRAAAEMAEQLEDVKNFIRSYSWLVK